MADTVRRVPVQRRRGLVLAVLCLALLIVTLDNTVLNVALPTLVRDLGATTTHLQWIVDAYVMVFAGLLLVGGGIADRIGRRRAFLGGLALFAAGSTWAAFSGGVGVLIAARAFMGVGGALIMPSTLSIITDLFREPGERQRAIGLWAATSGVGIALGPITGGVLLAHFWWGSIFLVNVPIAAVAIGSGALWVPESRDEHAPAADLPGAALSIAGLTLVVWGIIEAPVRGWASGRVLTALGLGAVVLLGFVQRERRARHPMLDLGYFAQARFTGAVCSVGLVMFGLFGALFVLTQFLQFALGYSALQAGMRALPAAGAIALVAPLSARLVGRIGARLVIVGGLAAIAAGLVQMASVSAGSGYLSVLPGMVLLGGGAGLTIPSATALVVGSVPLRHTGVGAATNGAFLQVGGALCVAVVGSLLSGRYQHRMASVLAPYPVPPAVRRQVLGSLAGAQSLATHLGGSAGRQLSVAARAAFTDGMSLGLAAAGGVAAGACLVALVTLPGRISPPPEGGDTTTERPAVLGVAG